jgi:hypothetical protein
MVSLPLPLVFLTGRRVAHKLWDDIKVRYPIQGTALPKKVQFALIEELFFVLHTID